MRGLLQYQTNCIRQPVRFITRFRDNLQSQPHRQPWANMKLMNDMRLIMSTVNRQGKILFRRAEGSIHISSLSKLSSMDHTHAYILSTSCKQSHDGESKGLGLYVTDDA